MVFDINYIMTGLYNVLQPFNMFICILGLFLGVLVGSLPGLTATMGVAMAVPFSYIMEPESALLLMSAIFCGGVYGGSIPAILLGIPGNPASAPTALEGRALTHRGESGRALMAGTVGATFGGIMTAFSLLLFSPILAKVAMKVGPPEQMMLAIFGLSVVVMLDTENIRKSLLVGFVCLLVATIGQDPVLGFPRFTFNLYQLTGGINVIPVLVGVFCIPEVLKMIEQPVGKLVEAAKVSKLVLHVKDITSNALTLVRSGLIGVAIGIMPAAGPDIAAFLSYNEAKKASKTPEQFGNGSYEGILAGETAANGCTGGDLVPLLTLGIPGSAPAALFLGAMIIHGLRPGPLLFTENAKVVYTMMVGFVIINVMMFFVGLLYCRCSSNILRIPKSILAPIIMVLAVVGTFATNQNMFDVVTLFAAGILGYIMQKFEYSVAPVALSLLLGPMLEQSLTLTNTMYNGNYMAMFTRPITDILFALTAISFIYPLIKLIKSKMAKRKEAK
ncbi:MAG: C4-dicarboxylate transporter permease [Clostridiales bacterium]|jgi:putative tricarboxylic transport membrane protein|nr:C4-dicarboxylate transporter permease [Clostridiales bacterium]